MNRVVSCNISRRFARDERGATATIFGLCCVVICGMVGLSIDLGRFVLARHSLQESLDAGVLALASARQKGDVVGSGRLSALIETNWQQPHGAAPPTLTFSEPNGSMIEATAKTSIPTIFISVLGITEVPFEVVAQSRYGLANSEVALALDVTASMTGTKLTTLKTLSKKMIDDVYSVTGSDQKVKFSLVPFGQYVNVGTSYRGASWLDVPPDGTRNVCTKYRPVTSKSGCTTRSVPVFKENEPTTYTNQETCTSYTYGPEADNCGQQTTLWEGCVGSPSSPVDAQVVANATNPVPGLPNIKCSSPLLRLTNTVADLKATIDGLTATGETYLPSGLIWGWRTLSAETPFQDGAPMTGGTRARKALVLMTDGNNTRSASSPTHDGTDTAMANGLTSTLCGAIKKDNVEIFTIAFEVTQTATLDLLQACASGASNFFDATDSARLEEAFTKIGDALTIARLVK